MPIDLKRIRKDHEYKHFVERSILLRRDPQAVSALESILKLDDEGKKTLKVLEECRREVKYEVDKESSKRLKATIQQLSRQHLTIGDEIRCALQEIPNVIDEKLEDQLQLLVTEENKRPSVSQEYVIDPVYCIGAYEEWGSQTVLTSEGIGLAQALLSYFKNCLEKLSGFHKSWQLPNVLVPRSDSMQPNCLGNNQHNGVELTPSWKCLLENYHKGKTYFDSQLPLFDIIITNCTNTDSIRSGDRTKTCKQEWFDRLISWQQIAAVVLTGSSLTADSRPAQIQFIKNIREMYAGIISSTLVSFRIRTVPLDKLCKSESSRLVLESYLPHSRDPLCLAFVSNLQDYICETTHHGNTDWRVHALHVQVCNIPEAIEWMIQHRTLQDCVTLPDVLQLGQALPYRRSISINKKGKRIVTEILLQQGEKEAKKPSLFGQPTPDEIRLERLSSPFDFLPFYYK